MNPQEYFDYAVKRLCSQIKNELMEHLPSENGWVCVELPIFNENHSIPDAEDFCERH